MIINMESGNFGSRPEYICEHLPLTKWDVILNERSLNINQQFMEKQISGMYLGEIVRLIIIDFIEHGLLFPGQHQKMKPRFFQTNEFETSYMSNIETDKYPWPKTNVILESFGILSTTDERTFVHGVVQSVSQRAAVLCSLQIAACVRQMEKESEHVVVAIDGSVYARYPGFKHLIQESLHELNLHKIDFVIPSDGSGVGAALASFMMKNLFSQVG